MNTSIKNLTLTMAGTVMLFGAQAVSAQDKVVASIPFDFKVNGTPFVAGVYQVTGNRSPGGMLFTLRPVTGGQGVLVNPNHKIDPRDSKSPAVAHLTFRCGSATPVCDLDQIWSGAEIGWKLRSPKLSPAERERLAIVNLTREPVGQ